MSASTSNCLYIYQRTVVLAFPTLILEHSRPSSHQFIRFLTLNDSQCQWQILAKVIFTRKSQKSGAASRLQHLLVTCESDDKRMGHAKSLDHSESNLSSTEKLKTCARDSFITQHSHNSVQPAKSPPQPIHICSHSIEIRDGLWLLTCREKGLL